MKPKWWSPLLLAALAGAARSQDTLEAQVAADPKRQGPPGLVWLREQWLPRLPGWPAGRDPLGPFLLRVRADGSVRVHTDQDPEGAYLRAEVRGAEGFVVRIECDRAGIETWQAAAGGPLRPDLARLLRRMGFPHGKLPVTLDVPALVGNLERRAAPNPHLGELVTLGSAACGEVVVKSEATSGGWTVRGRGAGGLLLPALSLLVATDRGAALPPTRDEDAERWLLLAGSARGLLREEAVRQLVRIDDPRAREILARTLHADEYASAFAMDGLWRLNEIATVDEVLKVATPEREDSEALAARLVVDAWHEASEPGRERLLAMLAAHPSPGLQALGDRLAGRTPAGQGGVDRASRQVIWIGLILAFAVLSRALIRERLRRASVTTVTVARKPADARPAPVKMGGRPRTKASAAAAVAHLEATPAPVSTPAQPTPPASPMDAATGITPPSAVGGERTPG